MPTKLPSAVSIIMAELTDLKAKYEAVFAENPDIKALQGIERCIELKMKIYALDGKQSPVIEDNPEITIDLSRLSCATLNEIVEATKKSE